MLRAICSSYGNSSHHQCHRRGGSWCTSNHLRPSLTGNLAQLFLACTRKARSVSKTTNFFKLGRFLPWKRRYVASIVLPYPFSLLKDAPTSSTFALLT
jgi:hypothetical protein